MTVPKHFPEKFRKELVASDHEVFDPFPDRMSERAELFDMGSEATLSRKEDAMEHDETEEHRWKTEERRYITSKRGRRNAERDINPKTGPGRSTISTTSLGGHHWITTTDEPSNQEQSPDYDDLPELVPCTPDTATDESSNEEYRTIE